MTKVRRVILPASEQGNDPNDHRTNPDYLKNAKPYSMSWVEDFMLSDGDIAQLKNPKWIIENLVISSHLIIIAAEPNGGKTTIFSHLAGEMSSKGYEVIYTNVDIGGSDAHTFIQQSKQNGWKALCPDFIPGLSIDDIIDNLRKQNTEDARLDNVVFIFDTFKKMCDVISKKRVKETLSLLRSLTAKGATVILLAHTNKYKGEDGQPIYEGTADVRSDADELIYLIPQKHDDRSMTVSTKPDKIRGDFEPITFHITPKREVFLQAQYIDTAAARKQREKYEKDMPDIEVIHQAFAAGKHMQSEIVEFCKEHRISKATTLHVLKTYTKGDYQQWVAERGFQYNTIRYYPHRAKLVGGG